MVSPGATAIAYACDPQQAMQFQHMSWARDRVKEASD
jgi:hypothetical protein